MTARGGVGVVAVGEELRLGDERDAVPRARSFVAEALRDHPALVEDATLIAAELVTNAILHGEPPITVRVRHVDGAAILEVADSSRTTPVRGRSSGETMTGRGLALVAALSSAWGVRPARSPGGKVVWARLAAPRDRARQAEDLPEPEIDVEGLVSAWSDEPAREPTFTIHLGGVPTELLLEAKSHVDNLVREFSLAAAGARSGHSEQVPAHLAALIETVVHRFAVPRTAIKRQALAAAARGEPRTSLTLTLPVSAADAGEEYLAALDEADAYARAARLLTLETPTAHKVFRRWYVEALVDQLRRRARGEQVSAPMTFEQRLIKELDAVAAAQRASEQTARLQTVTAALASVTTFERVAGVVVSEGVAALGASGGGLVLLKEGRVDVPAAVGYADELIAKLQAERLDEDLPAMVAARTREAVWVESPEERDMRFPTLSALEPGTVSLCAVPVALSGEVLGALRFSFRQARLFDETEQRFAQALAAQTAQALYRSELIADERAARDEAERVAGHLAETAQRLALLQKVTTELTGAGDVERIAEIVVDNAADAFGAQSARIYLLEHDMLRSVRQHGGAGAAVAAYHEIPMSADLPGPRALRTGEPVVLNSGVEIAEQFPALAQVYATDRRLLVAPLVVGDHRLGVLSLSFETKGVSESQSQVSFLTTLANACAQALERALASARAIEATDKLAFLAEASAVLASSIDFRETLSNVAQLIVPRLADWCTIQVVEGEEFRTLAVAHEEPEKAAKAERLHELYPIDPRSSTGVANVIRTGRSELYPSVSDQLLESVARDPEHLRMLREVGFSSALIVPLTGHAGTFGALTMIFAESGRRYDASDLSFAEDLARRAAAAVETATAFREQTGRLAAVTRVAAAAQRAILAPVPPRVGAVSLTARYVSAAAEAQIGGDIYEVVPRDGSVRLLVGDVRGKGLDAVRKATIVLGEFRAAAVELPDLVDVARQIDRRVAPYFDDEDFVTAIVAEITDGGEVMLASCGHPPALLACGEDVREVGVEGSLPLGLGAAPSVVSFRLEPGNRLLLYTDGILEARDRWGRFVDFRRLVEPLGTGDFATVLDRMLGSLEQFVGGALGDDLALLVAEYRPV